MASEPFQGQAQEVCPKRQTGLFVNLAFHLAAPFPCASDWEESTSTQAFRRARSCQAPGPRRAHRNSLPGTRLIAITPGAAGCRAPSTSQPARSSLRYTVRADCTGAVHAERSGFRSRTAPRPGGTPQTYAGIEPRPSVPKTLTSHLQLQFSARCTPEGAAETRALASTWLCGPVGSGAGRGPCRVLPAEDGGPAMADGLSFTLTPLSKGQRIHADCS